MTKPETIAKLSELGIAHDPKAKLADLQALLPKEAGATEEVAAVATTREERWDAFLVEARKVNPARFDAQKANGEFDKIPDSFV